MLMRLLGFLIIIAFSSVAWAVPQAPAISSHFALKSSAFQEGQSIPKVYTCDGKKISPPLSWEGVPTDTKILVLMVEDPDAPGGTWNHWSVYNIPPELKTFPENVQFNQNSIQQGRNSWGEIGYGAPCPPRREHRYIFKLYAINTHLILKKGANYSAVETAMKSHVLAVAVLNGRYKK